MIFSYANLHATFTKASLLSIPLKSSAARSLNITVNDSANLKKALEKRV